MTDRTSTRLSFVVGLLAALVLVPVLALAATTSPAAVQDGATFNANSGPELTAGEDMDVATHNVFPSSETVRLGPVTVSHAGHIETNLTGADTGLPTIRPQASPTNDLQLAHDNTSLSASVTGGSIDSLALSDAATVGDSADDIEIDTGGTGTTLTVSGLTTSQVTFIDTSGSQNQELATKSVSSGTASLSVGANAQRDILLATSPPGFDVSIDSTNSSIVEGQTLSVTATVNNTGGAQGTQTVTLDAGTLGTASTNVTLASGASQTVALSLATSTGDDGTYTATVSSDDDSDSAQVTVLENVPNFTVNVTNSNAPIDPGGTLTFDIAVENIGAKGDTQGIVVESGGTVIETTPTTLASGASTTIPVSIDASQTPIGATAEVSSDNESAAFVARESAWSQVNRQGTGSDGPVAISPDGSLVAHGEGSNVIVYETQSETPVQNISVASNGISALDWHPDGDRLAIGTFGNNLHIFDQSANTLLDTLNYGYTVWAVAWSPGGDNLAVAVGRGGSFYGGASTGAAYILDADSRGQLRAVTGGHIGRKGDVAWSASGDKWAVSAGGSNADGGQVRVFETGGSQLAEIDGLAFERIGHGVAFARDGTRIVTAHGGFPCCDNAGAVKLWDYSTQTQLDQVRGGGARELGVVADPAGNRVAAVGEDGPPIVLAVTDTSLVTTQTLAGAAPGKDVDWAHGGPYIATAGGSGTINTGPVWRVHTSLPVVDGTVTDSNGDPVQNATVELSQGGTLLDSVPVESTGAYTLVPPEPGTYTVTASFTGSSSAVIDSKTVSVPTGGITVPFTVSVVQQGIAGQIVDTDGDPISDSTIKIIGQSVKRDTSASGEFVLDTRDGAIDLRANAPDYGREVAVVNVPNGTVADVTIQLEQQTGFSISGTVVDSNGDPISGASVFAGAAAATTGPAGGYALAVDAGGLTTVTASTAVDSATQTVNVTGGASGVDFTLATADGGGSGGNVSGNLVLRGEQTGEILNNQTVNVTFSNPSEASIRSTDTGIVDMGEVPLAAPVVASADAEGFASRRIIVDGLDGDRNLFLLDRSNVSAVVLSEFELDDRTGEFSGPDTNVTLEVRRPMPLPGETDNIPWRVLLSDYIGAGDTIGMLMQPDERYRLRVRSESGNVREIGNYVPVRNKTVPLTIGELTWQLGDGEQNVSWDASQVNRSGSEHIRFQYLDRATATSGLQLAIYQTGNQSREIYNQTFAGPLSNVTVTEPIPASAANVSSWTVSYTATRDNTTVAAEVVVGPKKYPVGADSDWIPIFSALFLLFLSGFFSTKVANLGAIIVPGVATGLWAMGWLPVPLTWVLAALALGIGAEFAARGGFSDQ